VFWKSLQSTDYLPDDVRDSHMLDILFFSENLYGLPERKMGSKLHETVESGPYRLFSVDKFPHEEWHQQGLYSGIPYITGHSSDLDQSLIMMSASETWVDINER
jgi:alpha-glucosidase (family GH31 glycosyl hydrolase)